MGSKTEPSLQQKALRNQCRIELIFVQVLASRLEDQCEENNCSSYVEYTFQKREPETNSEQMLAQRASQNGQHLPCTCRIEYAWAGLGKMFSNTTHGLSYHFASHGLFYHCAWAPLQPRMCFPDGIVAYRALLLIAPLFALPLQLSQ